MKRKTNSITRRLLTWVETLTEMKTGKMCLAWVKFGFIIGFGKFTVTADDGIAEHYVFPFTIVTVFTPHVGTNIEQ
jgi:hypothetical protein